MADNQEVEIKAMPEEQLEAIFSAQDISGQDITSLASIGLQMGGNSKYTDAQRAEVEKAIWGKVDAVASHAQKLDPKEFGSFQSLLDNLPQTYRSELGTRLDTIKSAETRLYRAKNGIDDRTFGKKVKDGAEHAGEQIKEGFNEFGEAVKENYQQKKTKLKRNYNVGKRFARIAANKKKNQVKNWVKDKQGQANDWGNRQGEKVDNWVKNAVKSLENVEMGIRSVSGQIRNKYNRMQRANRIASERAKNRRKIAWRDLKNKWKARGKKALDGGKKIWNGTKKVVQTVGKISLGVSKGVAVVAYASYKAGKFAGNQLARGYKALSNIKLPSPKAKEPNDKSTSLELANGNLSKLSPEQIKHTYQDLKPHRDSAQGNKQGDAYYKVSAYSTQFLNDVKSGKIPLNNDNAEQVAAWLEVNRNIQEEVNKNRAKEHDDRNQAIDEMLKKQPLKKKEPVEKTAEPEAKKEPVEKTTEPKKDIYAELNLTDNEKKVVEAQYGLLKGIYNHPDGLLDTPERKAIVLETYKQSLKTQGLNDEQVGGVVASQQEANKDNPKYKDMFKEPEKTSEPEVKKEPVQQTAPEKELEKEAKEPVAKTEPTKAAESKPSQPFSLDELTKAATEPKSTMTEEQRRKHVALEKAGRVNRPVRREPVRQTTLDPNLKSKRERV